MILKLYRIIDEFSQSSRTESGRILVPLLDNQRIAAINQRLVQNDIDVYQISKIENDLERIFFDVIAE